jgi:hypothetical protein
MRLSGLDVKAPSAGRVSLRRGLAADWSAPRSSLMTGWSHIGCSVQHRSLTRVRRLHTRGASRMELTAPDRRSGCLTVVRGVVGLGAVGLGVVGVRAAPMGRRGLLPSGERGSEVHPLVSGVRPGPARMESVRAARDAQGIRGTARVPGIGMSEEPSWPSTSNRRVGLGSIPALTMRCVLRTGTADVEATAPPARPAGSEPVARPPVRARDRVGRPRAVFCLPAARQDASGQDYVSRERRTDTSTSGRSHLLRQPIGPAVGHSRQSTPHR